ncbi:hypothetical protein B7494_g6913 [Chlorociboria aeruginascens]|nr:hypothetical protein B7494_g6913 [Chlorociboria aeruginascens]
MARLNEPAAPVESIESLKRKFMRQNRDIARANSTQSLRIRNLENETSRLLAENLGLREQILRLQNELENGQAQRVADNSNIIKSQLEAKLLEIGALINDLGDEPPKRKPPTEGKARASPSRSPDQKNWKNMCTLSEAVAGQDGKLPPILENKYYPRRTLEHQELVNLVEESANTPDSPEIGPPPVSQFVDEDSVKISLPLRVYHPEMDEDEIPSLDPALSINLEQRKKRKDSIVIPEINQPAIRENTGSLRTGAKRKLSARDQDDDIPMKTTQVLSDEFKYTRVINEKTRNQPPESVATKVTRDLAISRGASGDRQSNSLASTNDRKVLAPKSVNDSPRKRAGGKASTHDEDVKKVKVDSAKSIPDKERSRDRRRETSNQPPPEVRAVERIEIQLEPETPATLDLFSPPSSQPSTARAESRDTPPPPDLGPPGIEARPSRRTRPSVSYAEPNLRDKMRRPTKELVDAVIPENHRTSIKIEEGQPTIQINSEPEAYDVWKTISNPVVENSPLSGKAPAPEILPSSITTHRKRRESMLHQAEEDVSQSGARSILSELLAGNNKSEAEAAEYKRPSEGSEEVADADAKFDIYEFRETSPHARSQIKPRKEARLSTRFPRRDSVARRKGGPGEESEASDIDTSQKPLYRRRQSTLSLKASSSTEPQGDDAQKTLRKSSSMDSGAGSRNERAAARRRSMML